MQILVGDIGGTKTVLAIAETDAGAIRLSDERRYASHDFASLEAVVARFFAETGRTCETAAFAVAGPVQDDRSEITNLPWAPSARHLERTLSLRAVHLLNDLEATAWGIATLGPADLEVLHPGEPNPVGNACVAAAGTGLGEAGMYWDGTRHRPFATQGGHADFAPRDDWELALLLRLQGRYGYVSWERVVSGMGIADSYDFLRERHGAGGSDPMREVAVEDKPAAIAAAAADGSCPVCAETMQRFMDFYGREAGNLALKHMAVGGVYLGGGIAPKNLDLLRRGPFLEAFFDKGPMTELMRRMPVKVILEQRAPLFGAARFAAMGNG
ncbi:glucokinase [Candidatus Thiosymbion oneisti]|uniref:glucokinase n=1 Tax=Candidatus Thiosymbion oneisti TaxID=589554 RepID=UPI000AB289D4|nr:glucokinase [Candidatus Thiosymbion oneisti]